MTAISENISQKPKRGRPSNPVLAQGVKTAEAIGCLAGVHSRHGKQNIAYRQRAVCVLLSHVDAPSFRWLADKAGMNAGQSKCWQPTILAELGRIDDPDEMVEVARQLCEMDPHPTVRDAVAMIRAWRTGSRPKADESQLAVAIGSTIERYVQEHSETTKQLVMAALARIRYAVIEKM